MDLDLKSKSDSSAMEYVSNKIQEGGFAANLQRKVDCAMGRSKTIRISTAPLSTILRKGPVGLNPPCLCSDGEDHISYFEAMSINQESRFVVNDYCYDRNSFLVGRLPCWATGMKNKTEFVNLPTVFHVMKLFSNTYWWRAFNHSKETSVPDSMSRISKEARFLLASLTECPEKSVLLPTKTLLFQKTKKPALGRVKNWFNTLDGLLISILLSSQGKSEILNWEFFDRVTQTYLKTAVFDLYKTEESQMTYYQRLKEYRNLMKDKLLKERTVLLPRENDGKFFPGNFWYFERIVEVLNLNVEIQNPAGLKTIAYLTQTRASGLPPEPVCKLAISDFLTNVSKEPEPLGKQKIFEISRAVDVMVRLIKKKGNFENLLNKANLHSKVSLSNSASFFFPREDGGKIEATRVALDNMPDKVPRFDLEDGRVINTFGKDNKYLSPGEKVFHYAIMIALKDLSLHDPTEPHIGDIRISEVKEPGKCRIITVSRVLHSIILHPLAHVLKVLIQEIDSSKTGMSASNHMWDTFARVKKDNMPEDTIFSGTSTFIGSEDWKEGTDRLNPLCYVVVLGGLQKLLGLPKFYTNLCGRLLTMPRRIYDREILKTKDFGAPIGVKRNGILQGDPLTKQMLHTTHILSRIIGGNLLKRVGLKSSSLPFKEDPAGNQYGCIPVRNNVLIKIRGKDAQLEDIKNFLNRTDPKSRVIDSVGLDQAKVAFLNSLRKD